MHDKNPSQATFDCQETGLIVKSVFHLRASIVPNKGEIFVSQKSLYVDLGSEGPEKKILEKLRNFQNSQLGRLRSKVT